MDYLIYIGKDKGFLLDVPARNLTKEEAERIGVEFLLASKLYIMQKAKTAPEKPSAEVKEK